MSESLAGTIERVTFHNPENGFVVLRVEVKGLHGLATVVGQAACAQAGEYLEATGKWEEDSEHGAQFKADNLRTVAPSTPEGIEKKLEIYQADEERGVDIDKVGVCATIRLEQ